MRKFTVIVVLLLSGCGVGDRVVGGITGFARTCADGVMYYQFTSGAAPAYNLDGTLKACK